jgi:adenylate kinase family enzyme
MRRVAIIGITGVGKTTFAAALAARLGVPHIELDSLYWGPNWSRPPREVFRGRVAAALRGEAWIADGTYITRASDITWTRADTLVWLDYPLSLVVPRLVKRAVRRLSTGQELWGGNRECLSLHFSSYSPIAHALQNHLRHRRLVPELIKRPEFAHLDFHHFVRPQDAERWLELAVAADGVRRGDGRG